MIFWGEIPKHYGTRALKTTQSYSKVQKSIVAKETESTMYCNVCSLSDILKSLYKKRKTILQQRQSYG
jgi:hypothetical protein